MRKLLLLIVLIASAAGGQTNYSAYAGGGLGGSHDGLGFTGSAGIAAVNTKHSLLGALDLGGIVTDSDGAVKGSARLFGERLFLNSGEGLGVGGGITASRRTLVAASMVSDGLTVHLFGILPTDSVHSAGVRGEASFYAGSAGGVPIIFYPYLEVTRQDIAGARHARAVGGVELRLMFWNKSRP